MESTNIGFRAGITILLALGGFLFPPLFLVAALAAWALFKDVTDKDQPRSDARHLSRWTATADDPDWKSYFLSACESPAECAFLEAMIASCELAPRKGTLTSFELEMALQAELQPYRVDFLVNDWLIVEIDGAAYHSSPEAIARDEERDQFFLGQGYRVLRIPAKTVFAVPAEAVRQVRVAVTAGRPVSAATGQQRQPKSSWSLGQALTSIDKFVTDVNTHVDTAKAVQAATQQSHEAFNCERMAIDCAVESAVRKLEVAAYRAKSAEHARHFDEAYASIETLFDDEKPTSELTVLPIYAPGSHQNPTIDAAIKDDHKRLMDERSKYFETVRARLNGDHRLGVLVKDALDKLGCSTCWSAISD